MASSRLQASLLALGLLVAAACSEAARRPALPPATPQSKEFFAHLRADKDHAWLEESSADWLAAQPTEVRVDIAERALRDADPAVRLIAPMQFYVMHMDERGDAAIAQQALRGDEVGAFSWSWLHDRDATMFERRLTAIRLVILRRYDELTSEERANAEKMLCDEGKPCDLRAEAAALKNQG
jgi:hypothetical protein